MRGRSLAALFLLLFGLFVTNAAPRIHADPVVELWGILEESIQYANPLNNPWMDATLDVKFTDPAGQTTDIEGFFYGGTEWRFRFAPGTVGSWSWKTALISPTAGTLQVDTGTFTVTPSKNTGFLKVQKTPFPPRLVGGDGSAFPLLGIGDCMLDLDGEGSPLSKDWGIELGDQIPGRRGQRYADLATYAAAYGKNGAGFNIFRLSLDNCSYKIFETISPDGNRYRERESKWTDSIISALRKEGFKIYFVLFGFRAPFQSDATAAELAAVSNYARYVVARYGALVDVWELANEIPENEIDSKYVTNLVKTIHQSDPYDHPISTSFEQPGTMDLDIVSPHWYAPPVPEEDVDRQTADVVVPALHAEKPLIYGEAGNREQNWDPANAARLRVRLFTTLLSGGSLIFWNTSSSKEYRAISANIYLGSEERAVTAAFQRFASKLGPKTRPIELRINGEQPLPRGYAMKEDTAIWMYLNSSARNTDVSATIMLDVPWPGVVTWSDPRTNDVIAQSSVLSGPISLRTPPFQSDIAGVIRPAQLEADASQTIRVGNVLIRSSTNIAAR